MEYEIKYTGNSERWAKIAEFESQGLRMIEDNFVSGWRHGEEPRGVMVFTDQLEPPPLPQPATAVELIAALDKRLKAVEDAMELTL